ncbi:MAG: PQQ-binding-like beta-propeller repeat protein, partial [Planctomycetia bacterium]|nr:PQQ-binding-like beta-propeller repeat protein [Planctomycetia bacterium]
MKRSISLWTVAALATLAAGIDRSRGEDWPQWRGPNRDGICTEKGLVASWNENNPPPVVFEAKGLGSGYSSVTVSKGRVYTMGGKGGRANVVCLDEKTGEIVWSTPIGGGGETNCTPTVDGDLVYGLSTQGDLACLKTDDGSIVWTKNFKSDFGGSMMSGWG